MAEVIAVLTDQAFWFWIFGAAVIACLFVLLLRRLSPTLSAGPVIFLSGVSPIIIGILAIFAFRPAGFPRDPIAAALSLISSGE